MRPWLRLALSVGVAVALAFVVYPNQPVTASLPLLVLTFFFVGLIVGMLWAFAAPR